MSRISIIIPCYNAAQTLGRCLDSILAQGFTDYEVILADDGSTDGTAAVMASYAAGRDSFITVSKPNGGVSSARNAALAKASGEWVYFADADDFLEPRCLETLVSQIRDGVCMVMAGYREVGPGGTVLQDYPASGFSPLDIDGALVELFRPSVLAYQGYLWDKLFRKDIIDGAGLRFDEDIFFNEDRLFIFRYLRAASGLVQSSTVPVYVKVSGDGAMASLGKGFTYKHSTDFEAFARMVSFSCGLSSKVREALLEGMCLSCRRALWQMVSTGTFSPSVRRRMLCGLRKAGAMVAWLRRPLKDHILMMFPRLSQLYLKLWKR